jgi:glycosyltransferase involved in cell wall biosynthesis
MTRIRVAHLITNFRFGGAQDYLLHIVRGLDRTQFQPVIAGRLEGEWVPVVESMGDVEVYDIPAMRRDIAPLDDVRSVFQVRKFCREKAIDILHTHSSKAGVVGRLGGTLAGHCSRVHTIHGFSFNDFMPWWKRAIYVQMERIMSSCTTTLLLYSHADERTARRLGIGARHSVETFYYGIDFAPFALPVDRQAVRGALGLKEHDKVIGFTGRFSEQKGLFVLVDAFARIRNRYPECRLLLVGDGPLRTHLEDRIRRLGLDRSVVITGIRSDVPALLRAMDLFVMTSFWEGLSRSLAEAMFASLPVIATDVGGTSDAVRNGETGWLIPANDVDAAVEAITDALEHPARAGGLAAAGLAWARNAFEPGAMNTRIAELYKGLMANHRN